MIQEVRVTLLLTLEVDKALTEKAIGNISAEGVIDWFDKYSHSTIYPTKVKILEVKEQIQSESEEEPGLAEYIKKYNIDVKRQTKIDFNGD